jgi:hypothetical protein
MKLPSIRGRIIWKYSLLCKNEIATYHACIGRTPGLSWQCMILWKYLPLLKASSQWIPEYVQYILTNSWRSRFYQLNDKFFISPTDLKLGQASLNYRGIVSSVESHAKKKIDKIFIYMNRITSESDICCKWTYSKWLQEEEGEAPAGEVLLHTRAFFPVAFHLWENAPITFQIILWVLKGLSHLIFQGLSWPVWKGL